MDLDGRPIQRQPPLQDETRKVEAKPEPENKWKRSRASYSFVGTARISGSRNARHAHACTRVTVGGPRPLVWSVGHPSDPQGPATIVTSGCARGMDHATPRRAAPTVPCGCPRRPIHRRRVRARAPRTRLVGTAGSCPKTLRPAAVDDARATRLRPAGIASPLLFHCDYSSAASCTQTEKTTRARTSACAHPPPGFQRGFTAGVCFGVGVLQRPSPNPVCVLSRNRRERCC